MKRKVEIEDSDSEVYDGGEQEEKDTSRKYLMTGTTVCQKNESRLEGP